MKSAYQFYRRNYKITDTGGLRRTNSVTSACQKRRWSENSQSSFYTRKQPKNLVCESCDNRLFLKLLFLIDMTPLITPLIIACFISTVKNRIMNCVVLNKSFSSSLFLLIQYSINTRTQECPTVEWKKNRFDSGDNSSPSNPRKITVIEISRHFPLRKGF